MPKITITSISDLQLALDRIQELKDFEPNTPEARERAQLIKAIDHYDAENLAFKPK